MKGDDAVEGEARVKGDDASSATSPRCLKPRSLTQWALTGLDDG